MTTKKTLAEVVAFAAETMAAANFRGARPVQAGGSMVSVEVNRTFRVQAAVILSFGFETSDRQNIRYIPRVAVNYPAVNCDVLEATAMLALIQEVTLFAASLQAQLNEFEIPVDISEK